MSDCEGKTSLYLVVRQQACGLRTWRVVSARELSLKIMKLEEDFDIIAEKRKNVSDSVK